MSHDAELHGPSELMRLLEIDFEEIGPTRVTGSAAADERTTSPGGSSTAVSTRP
jgi:acyl-coenzyme A thioesterase PaaI-like protein